jgi:putative sigma-54 modulation protein
MKGAAAMELDIRGVHYEVTEEDRQLIEKKLKKIEFAEGSLVSIHFAILQDKSRFESEATLHFRWGNQIIIHVTDYHLHEGLEKLFKKMKVSVIKEKERIKER